MNKVHPTFADLLDSAGGPSPSDLDDNYSVTNESSLAGQLYRERRRRDEWFKSGLFWEPGWDLLLYLYDRYKNGHRSISVGSLASKPFMVSKQSAARWLNLLIGNGYIEMPESTTCIVLTREGLAAIEGYLGDAEDAC